MNARAFRDNKKENLYFYFVRAVMTTLYFCKKHSIAVDESSGSISGLIKFFLIMAQPHLLFLNSAGKTITCRSSGNAHWLLRVLELDGQLYILINIYGFNSASLSKILMSDISSVNVNLNIACPNTNLIVGGDFIMV